MDGDNKFLREFGKFRLDTGRKILWHDRKTVAMPLKELELLSLLVENQGKLVTKDELLEKIWADSFVSESNLSRHIYLLRKTLRDFDASQDLIENIPRRGYRFTGKAREVSDDEIIIERHSVSETLIEIREEKKLRKGEKEKRFVFQKISSPLLLLFFSASALLFGGFAFWIYQNTRAKTSGAGIKSIVVLPFKTVDAANANEHQGLGMADVLITRLSNIKQLTVRPTSAITQYENQEIDSVEAGRKLQADAVLEGTIYRAANEIRVTMRLLKTSDSKPIWAGQFEKPVRDELQIQDEIALQVADALALNLSIGERNAVSKSLTESADALALYQKGRFEWNKRNFQGSTEAERLFRNAIAEDPNFALAYVGLADTIAMRTDVQEAYGALQKALEIDPNLAQAHATLGFLQMFHEWNWQEAETELKKSIELNPGYATAHHWYATLLEIEGRNAEAKAEFERAFEINPFSYNFLADLGQAYYFNHEYDKAKEYCRKALEIYPDFIFAHDYLFLTYLQTGETDAAIEEHLKSHRIGASFANFSTEGKARIEENIAQDREVYKNGGIKGYFAMTLEKSQKPPVSFYFPAMTCAFLGDKEKALDFLERAFENKELFTMPFVKADPIFDSLRDEPRYKEILRKMNL
jgi:DNA-binding winged helix-turn-helix (wHTH) protein/TolB-like protein/Tfp pilus assembly protein PilF